jgi:hypothetical protein
MAYTKLFNEIVTSTIWAEPDHVRIVWITMLAIKDIRQEVQASVPGLAHFARVSVEQCREAIKVLESPDLESRTKDFEGRRIQPIDGGWLILNGDKYRDKMSKEHRREYKTKKQREYYWQNKENAQPVQKSPELSRPGKIWTTSTQAEAEAEAYKYNTQPSEAQATETVSLSKSVTPPPLKGSAQKSARTCEKFETFWKEYPKKRDKMRCLKTWNARNLDAKIDAILLGLDVEKKSSQWLKDQGEFIPHPSTWLNNERWETARLDVDVKPVDFLDQIRELRRREGKTV